MRLRDVAAAIAALATLGFVNASGADAIREFLDRHWRRPLAPQGPPPARFSPLEASLQPEACGTCHPAQFADWKTRSEEHTSELQSQSNLVCRLLLEKKKDDPTSRRRSARAPRCGTSAL